MVLRRFVAASAVASVVIAIASTLYVLAPARVDQQLGFMPVVWCFLPLLWGLWAVLTPQNWMPDRLPRWGAILGFIVGFLVIYVMNVPALVLAQPPNAPARVVGVCVAAVVYYLLWHVVRNVHRRLTSTESEQIIAATRRAA